MVTYLKGRDFYTFVQIDWVSWDKEDSVLESKPEEIKYSDYDEETGEVEETYRSWDDELNEELIDRAWTFYNQYGDGYDDSHVMDLKEAIGEAIIEGFKKAFNIRVKGNAKSIGEEAYSD